MSRLQVKKNISVKEARRLFVDSKEHDDFGILGYYRIVLCVFGDTAHYPENSFNAKRIDKALTKLRANYQQIIWLRFWCCNTLKQIGELAGKTRESVRQLQRKALIQIEASKEEFLEKDNNLIQEREKILEAMKRGKYIDTCIAIDILRLPVRVNNALKAANIRTLGNLFSYSQKELLNLRSIGDTSIFYINEGLDNFIPGLRLKKN